jgi:hypothetical protein
LGKISTDIYKSSFSRKHADQYKLSILIGVDSLSYCICNPTKELLVLRKIDFIESAAPLSLSEYLQQILEQEQLLQLPYQSVFVYWVASHFTIIPSRLYSEADKASYLTPLKAASTVAEKYLSDHLPSISSQLIYTIPTDVKQLLNKTFNRKYKLCHSFSSLIDCFSKQAGNGKEVFLNVRDYQLQLFFFDNKELIFVNQFKFESAKDFLYYVLLTFDQFKLSSTEIPLKVAGTISEDSTIYQQIYRYIKQISFIDLPTVFQSDLDLKDYPAHQFFDVLHAA